MNQPWPAERDQVDRVEDLSSLPLADTRVPTSSARTALRLDNGFWEWLGIRLVAWIGAAVTFAVDLVLHIGAMSRERDREKPDVR